MRRKRFFHRGFVLTLAAVALATLTVWTNSPAARQQRLSQALQDAIRQNNTSGVVSQGERI